MKPLFNQALIATLVLASSTLVAQKLTVKETEITLSKEASKAGMYVNTTSTDDGNVQTFISYDLKKKGGLGFDVISYDLAKNSVSVSSDVANGDSESKYGITIPKSSEPTNPAQGVSVVRQTGSAGVLGKLKVEQGYFKPKYAYDKEEYDFGSFTYTTYTPVLKGYKFETTSSEVSSMKLNIFTTNCPKEDNLEKSYLILEGLVDLTAGYFNQSADIAFIGKNAQWDADSPNGSNVVTTGMFNGKTGKFTNVKEHALTYNQRPVVTGVDGKGNASVLVSTLNAPSSVAAWKKFQAKGKNYMTYMTIDQKSNVIDNVTFTSHSVRGNFGIFGFDDEHFVLGSVNGKHEGYCRDDVGSATDFQIVKIQGGKVAAQEVYSMDQLAGMVTTPGGKKGKLKLPDVKISKCESLPNGDLLAVAVGPKEYYAFQFDHDAKMKKVYVIPRVPGGKFDLQFIPANNDEVFLVFKSPIARGMKKTMDGYGLIKTDVDLSRIDAAMAFARIVKLNFNSKSCSEFADVQPDVIMGEDTVFKGKNEDIVFLTRSTKGKYKMISVK